MTYIRQEWRNAVAQDIKAINAAMEAGGRKQTWLLKKIQEYGVFISHPSLNGYLNGKTMPPQEFIDAAKEILGIPQRKVRASA